MAERDGAGRPKGGRLPPEVKEVEGNYRGAALASIPDSLKSKVPVAEWLENPEAFDKNLFIDEVAGYLFTVYGIGTKFDRHGIAMLANALELYIQLYWEVKKDGPITDGSQGQKRVHPAIKEMDTQASRIVTMFSQYGLTPSARLKVDTLPQGPKTDDPLDKAFLGKPGLKVVGDAK